MSVLFRTALNLESQLFHLFLPLWRKTLLILLLVCLCAALAFWKIFAKFFLTCGLCIKRWEEFLYWYTEYFLEAKEMVWLFFLEFSSHQKSYFLCNIVKTSLHHNLHDGNDYQHMGLLMMLNEHSLLNLYLSSNRHIDLKKPNPFLLRFSLPSCSQIITKTHCGLTRL